ncbi:MAG: hypothetical protein U1F25_14430 [Rubrivivax sp.]
MSMIIRRSFVARTVGRDAAANRVRPGAAGQRGAADKLIAAGDEGAGGLAARLR